MATPKTKADLLAAGYGGYASWNDERSIMDDFAATGGQGKYTGGASSAGSTGSTSSGLPTTDFSSIYNTIVGKQQALGNLSSSIRSEYNVDPLQKTATALENAYAALPENTTQQGQRLGMSQSQQQLLYGRESTKLAPTVQQATQEAQTAETAANTRFGQESALGKSEIDQLLTLYSTGATLTDNQAKRLNDLAIAEENNQTTLKSESQKGIVETIGNGKYFVFPNDPTRKPIYLGSVGTDNAPVEQDKVISGGAWG